ncbi:MAG: hypothetical protein M0P33_06635, partial [Massilibacteroides sp.]|nr:hypothetical protein [Massilibacteroides sp.]
IGPREMDKNGVPLITKMIERYHDVMLWDAYQTTTLRNNLWICDNGWDVDLDDGSTNYDIYNNLCLRGGLKTREGYHRKVYNNVIFNYYTCNVPYPKPTYDQFRSNIIIGKSYVSSDATLWGGLRDYTFFHNPEYVAPIPATAIRDWTHDDANSLVGNAGFVDLQKGNFRLKTNSPAFALGFKNFENTGFGVTSEKLKRRVPEPVIILPSKYFDNTLIDEKKRSVWGATIGTLDTESKLTAYGAKSLEGAILSKLPEKSKLHKLGFRVDDVILKIDQFKIGTAQDLIQFFRKAYLPGSAYQVKLLRGQKEIKIKF